MKLYSFALFFASLLLYSCGGNSSSNSNGDLSQMDRVEIKDQQQIPVDSVIEKIDYIKLGKTGDALIGQVTHLLFTPDHIIVGDADQAKAIFIFDRAGNSQAVINRLGRGPQEYQGITDIDISPDQKKIIVLDSWGDKLLTFDMNGNFLNKQTFTPFSRVVKWLDPETILIGISGGDNPELDTYTTEEDLLLFMDSTLQFKYSAFPNRFNSDIFKFDPLVVKRFDDRVLISVPYSDTIYQYTSHGIQPRYKLDMEEVDGIANFANMSLDEIDEKKANHTSFFNIYTEADNYAMFFLSDAQNKVFPVLFNKKTKQTYNIGFTSSSPLGIYVLHSKHSYKDQFISVIPAFQFLTYCPDDVPGIELWNEIKEGLTDEDNPVLLFYTLKDPE